MASDDSDFEESQSSTSGKVTSQMVNEWEKELSTNKYEFLILLSAVNSLF